MNAPQILNFFVQGDPMPQGSKFAFVNKHTGKAQIIDDNVKRLKPWRAAVSGVAIYEASTHELTVPFKAATVQLIFNFTRPASLAKRITRKTTMPDVDKLARSVLDALTGIVFQNDAHVVALCVSKQYASPPGVQIEIVEVQP